MNMFSIDMDGPARDPREAEWENLGMVLHPAAMLFPSLSGQDQAELKWNIETHGVREPIWVDRKGRLLDGRHRKQACNDLDMECPQRVYEGDDPVAFVVSMNLHRRHLTTQERAEVAARITTLRDGGARPGTGPKKFSTPNGELNKPPKKRAIAGATTIKKAAQIMKVGTMSVCRAKKRLGLSQPKKSQPRLRSKQKKTATIGGLPSTTALKQELYEAVVGIRVRYPYEQRRGLAAVLLEIAMNWDDRLGSTEDEVIRAVDWTNPRCRWPRRERRRH